MTEQTRKRVTIDAPSPATILAARHLDATEGPVQVGKTVTSADRSAIDQVLRYIAKAHNSPAAPGTPPSGPAGTSSANTGHAAVLYPTCDAYHPPTQHAECGVCARCGMYDWRHAGAGVECVSVARSTLDFWDEQLSSVEKLTTRIETEKQRAGRLEVANRALKTAITEAVERAEQAEVRLRHLEATSEAAGALLTRTTDGRDQLRDASEVWRHKAVRRALEISRLEGVIQAVNDLAHEEITPRTSWADGYRDALADLRDALREFGHLHQPSASPAAVPSVESTDGSVDPTDAPPTADEKHATGRPCRYCPDPKCPEDCPECGSPIHDLDTEAAEDLSDYYAPDPPIGCLTATTTPASSTRRRLRAATVDTHTWDGTHTAVTAWLADTPHHWDGNQLVIPADHGDVHPQPGWTLARWDDGKVSVLSPDSAARFLEPDGEPDDTDLTETDKLRKQLSAAIDEGFRTFDADETEDAYFCEALTDAVMPVVTGHTVRIAGELRVRTERLERRAVELEAMARDADRLRRDWTTMRDRAETAEQRADRYAATLDEILTKFEIAFPSPEEPMRRQATVSVEDHDRWISTLNPKGQDQ